MATLLPGFAPSPFGVNGSVFGFAARAKRWDKFSKASHVALLVTAAIIGVTCVQWLSGNARFSGLMLSGLSAALGVAGFFVSGSEKLPLRTLTLVALGACGLFTLLFVDQVYRDEQIHCALSETFVRVSHLEELVQKLKHDDMMVQMYFRLNELDDLLSEVQAGTAHHVDKKHEQLTLAVQDHEFIAGKLKALKSHTSTVITNLRNKKAELEEAAKNATTSGTGSVADMQALQRLQEEAWDVEKHLSNAQLALNYLEEHSGPGGQMGTEEYEIILDTLMAAGYHPPLKQELDALPVLRDAWKRKADLATAPAAPLSREMDALQKQRAQARTEFEERFGRLYESHPAVASRQAFQSSLYETLADMPSHCLHEVAAYKVVKVVGALQLVAVVAASYTALTAFVFQAKRD